MRSPSEVGVLEARLLRRWTRSREDFNTTLRHSSFPLFRSKQSNSRVSVSSMTATKYIRSPMMIGEACPLPLIGVFQTRFSGNFQSTGAFGSLTVPSPNAPLHAGQSSAQAREVNPFAAKAAQAKIKNLLMPRSCRFGSVWPVKTKSRQSFVLEGQSN